MQRLQLEVHADGNKLHRRIVGVWSWQEALEKARAEVTNAQDVSSIRIFRKNGGKRAKIRGKEWRGAV